MASKETPAQRAERIKLERNPWEMMPDLIRYAREGFASIPDEDLNLRFRWWGLYTQGDGRGAMGGAVPYFMMRIRVPNGFLHAHQVRTIADLSERYARGVADVTVRQNFQLHWLRIEDIPDVLFSLYRGGLTTTGACGDDTRNLVGCPLAGVDADEIADASAVLLQANRMLEGNAAYYNLPRKYKIGITGCRLWCSHPEINDIGLTATRRPDDPGCAGRDGGEVGFNIRIGGGLSTHPHFGIRLPAFVRWNQALPVITAVTEIFRGAEFLRHNREKARLKFLFLQHGWTAASFLAAIEERLGYALDPDAGEQTPPAGAYRDHVGIHVQRQPGLSYAGLSVLRGRLTAADLGRVADLAERYGDGTIRTTTMQNIVILNVPTARARDLARDVVEAGLHLEGSAFRRGTIACTGSEFCKLAVAETKGLAQSLVEALEQRVPEFDGNVKLHIAGCPNDCGQHWIADIGLQGAKVKVEGRLADAFDVFLGGSVGAERRFARRVNVRVPAADLPDTLARLLRSYLEGRGEGERLPAFLGRHREAELRDMLLGLPAAGSTVGSSAEATPGAAAGGAGEC
ncbi:MAG TPA: nitrite reductase [bacterium]|nr:nitrite reductase [bacterium]